MEETQEEAMMEYYLHKSIMSDMTYQEYKAAVTKQITPAISEEAQEKALEIANQYIKAKKQ